MWKIKESAILFTVFVFYPNTECCNNIEDYYWRDYRGIIPSDALPGGVDKSGKPIYIGQILLHGNNLVTTKMYLNDNKGYFAWDNKETSGTDNMKVLCTQHPQRFQWINTTVDDIEKLTDRNLVIGGFQHPNYIQKIGRAYHMLETTVGRVTTGDPVYNGLYITYDGKEIKLTSFDVLAYMK